MILNIKRIGKKSVLVESTEGNDYEFCSFELDDFELEKDSGSMLIYKHRLDLGTGDGEDACGFSSTEEREEWITNVVNIIDEFLSINEKFYCKVILDGDRVV